MIDFLCNVGYGCTNHNFVDILKFLYILVYENTLEEVAI